MYDIASSGVKGFLKDAFPLAGVKNAGAGFLPQEPAEADLIAAPDLDN